MTTTSRIPPEKAISDDDRKGFRAEGWDKVKELDEAAREVMRLIEVIPDRKSTPSPAAPRK